MHVPLLALLVVAASPGLLGVDAGEHQLASKVGVDTSIDVVDGVARARFTLGAHGSDVSVLVRATERAPGELDDAYAFRVSAGVLSASRYDHGVERAIDVSAPLTGGAPRALEIAVLFAGPYLSATAYDGVTLAPRAHIELHDDAGPQHGSVGARANTESGDAVTSLSVLDARAPWGARPNDDGAASDQRVVRVDGGPEIVIGALEQERLLRAHKQVALVRSPLAFMDEDADLRAKLTSTSTAPSARVDESYKDADMVAALVQALAAAHPQIARAVPFGHTASGRILWALEVAAHPGGDVDTVLLDGGHHGGELMSIEFVLDAADRLVNGYGRDAQMTAFVDGLDIWLVPLVNVDGNMRFVHETIASTRTNAPRAGSGGVDLYRNYPADFGGDGEVGSRSNPYHYRYRGPSAASEPEVGAMMDLADAERFTASIDFHTNATAVLVPYTDPKMISPEPNEAWTIAQLVAHAAPVQASGRAYTVRQNLYPVDGTYQDWLRLRYGTVALLVEGPLHNPLPYLKMRAASVDGTRPTWIALFDRALHGSGLLVHSKDASGKPVEAAVVVDEQVLHMGERWTTRPRDGRMHRLLPAGTYTVRAHSEDGRGAGPVRVVVSEGNPAALELVLTSP